MRVLKWILERVEGRGEARETPIGFVPGRTGLTLDGLKISPEALDELFRVSTDDWEVDLADCREFFSKFGSRLPAELRKEYDAVVGRFQKSVVA